MFSGDVTTSANVGGFNLETAIADFLVDSVRASLELPATLTAEQRKLAKKAVESHDIKCESYGLGAERRLHLFKQANIASMKDIATNDSVASREENAVPSQFSAFLDGIGKFDLAPIAEATSEEQRFASPCSTTATGISSLSSSPNLGSQMSVDRELPALPDGLHIRNTFIHMEPEPVNERAVQSMPHDMFRRCLLAEAEAAKADKAPLSVPVSENMAAAPPPDHSISAWWNAIGPGVEVIIEGLVKLPAFNGLTGTVQSLDVDTGRYNILLTTPVGAHQWAKVKRDNLRLAPPHPPRNAPTLDLEDTETCQASLPTTPHCATPTWEDGSPLRLNVNALV